MPVGNGLHEFDGNDRDVSGKLSSPNAVAVVQGMLGTIQAGGTPQCSILHSTSALNVVNGKVTSGATAGVAGDSQLLSVVLPKNGTPLTLIIAGFVNEAGTAKTLTLTGSSTNDTVYNFAPGLINTGGPMTLTTNVADLTTVTVAPFGPPNSPTVPSAAGLAVGGVAPSPSLRSTVIAPGAGSETVAGQTPTRSP